MIVEARQAPDHFQTALESIHSVNGCQIMDAWKWYEHPGVWALRFQLDIGDEIKSSVPRVTEWYVLVSDRYPLGRIRVYPSVERGVTVTFQHQRFNRTWLELPWTKGEICTDVPGYLLDRLVHSPEPFSITERLAWHINKAKEWIKAAAADDLVRLGEPFELPDFPIDSSDHREFTFSEGTDSITKWAEVKKKSGLVRLSMVSQINCKRVVPQVFLDSNGQVLMEVNWGNYFNTTDFIVGGWILLPQIPIISPWQAPITWAELYDISTRMGVNMQNIMTNVFAPLRDGQSHLLLFGFPIPEAIGGPVCLVHWQALSLPRLSTIEETKQGFRPTKEGAMQRDLGTILTKDKALKWLDSDNWDKLSWGSRGRLDFVNGLRVVIIGLGAVGSAIVEMLVRGGIDDIVLIDGDEVKAGNLVRHTLTLVDEGKNKAVAVASRLNEISPHARVEALASYLDPRDLRCRTAIEQADLVIDCTADDGVLTEIHEFSWRDTTILASVSIGLNGERIYIYSALGWSFSFKAFQQSIAPRIQEDYETHPGFILPRESTGCWHPVFPARSNDIWFLSSLAIREIEDILRKRLDRAELRQIKFDGQLHREVM